MDAVRALDPRPRERQWVSLSFCVLDAVYSIGANYDKHVVPVVRRVADDFGIEVRAATPTAAKSIADPVPLDALLERYPDTDSLLAVAINRQNTSPRGGIRKADAVIRYARILDHHGVHTLADGRAAISDSPLIDQIDNELRSVPGEGASGVRRGYLWMLIGDENLVKPDRMVLWWLARNGFDVDAPTARTLLAEVAAALTVQRGRVVTPWEVDHGIWPAARRR